MNGYADGELDLISALKVEQHLQECHACTGDYRNQQSLSSAISGGSFYFKAPTNLRKRVQLAVREAHGEEPGSTMFSWRWLSLAVSAVLVAVIIWGFFTVRSTTTTENLLARDIVSGHVRSLMADHLADVLTSDQHTVKPWFDGKLDFAPPVADLTSQGFPLVGGRLDYIGNRPVAALVYQHRQHFINLFIWPSANESESGNKMMTLQGYNLVRWNKLGMTFWAVSDLNLNELQEFSQAVQKPS
jgi:anti-sigma factor RsiW